jgi:hypothetical protein
MLVRLATLSRTVRPSPTPATSPVRRWDVEVGAVGGGQVGEQVEVFGQAVGIDQVQWSLTQDLVGDVGLTQRGVPDLGRIMSTPEVW